MGEAAAPRRAKAKIGDFTFCLLAAALGLGLLFATGRHLFGSPYAVPQTAPPQVADGGVSRSGSVGAVAPVRDAAPNRNARTVSRAALRTTAAPIPHRVAGRGSEPRPRPHVAAKPAKAQLGGRAKALLGGPAKALPLPVAAVPNRQFLPQGVAPARASRQVVRAHGRVGPHLGAGALPRPTVVRVASATPRYRRSRAPEQTSVFRPAPIIPPKRRTSSAPHNRGKAQALAARARAIVEPPLGYELTPALLVAPGAERLDLGSVAVPTIAARRRH